MKTKKNAVIIALALCLLCSVSNAQESSKDKSKTQLDIGSTSENTDAKGNNEQSFMENLTTKEPPFKDSTNFDNHTNARQMNAYEIGKLKLKSKIPDAENFTLNYKLKLSDNFYTFAISYTKGEYELFTDLITFDKDYNIIDKLNIAYDEIGESWFSKRSMILKDSIILEKNYSAEDSEGDTLEIKTTYKIGADGKFTEISTKIEPKEKPNNICECAEKKCSDATKNFIARICQRPGISVEEIDKFISQGADINSAFRVRYENEDEGYSDDGVWYGPIFYFIEKGAKLDVTDEDGNIILMRQLQSDDNLKLIKLLLDKKAAVNVSNYSGKTPLSIAVESDNIDYVKLLLENKANPNKGIIEYEKGKFSLLEYAAFRGNVELVELLIKHGAKVKDTYAHLLAADKASNVKKVDNYWAIVILLLAKGADINAIARDAPYKCDTLLSNAIVQHNLDMVKYLIEHGANLNLEGSAFTIPDLADRSTFNPTPDLAKNAEAIKEYIYSLTETMDEDKASGYLPIIHYAVNKRDLEKVQQILKDVPSQAKAVDKNDNTPLHFFFYGFSCADCGGGDDWGISDSLFKIQRIQTEDNVKPILELLLKNGANVKAVNKNGTTPIHAAVKNNAPEEFISVLLKHSEDINARDKFGKTPLHYVESAKMAEFFIKNGADVNVVSSVLKRTPLHEAAIKRYQSEEITKVLVKAGADIKAKDKYGKTAFDLATENDNSPTALYLKNLEGASPNEPISGSFPIALAAENKDWETVKLLLEKGAKIDGATSYNSTALYFAVRNSNIEMVRYLTERGADVNTVNKGGDTPLSRAVYNGNLEIVKFLMEHGAKPGKGIINDAVGKKADINIIKCLIANGAKISEESLREYLCTYVKERPIEITKYLIENGTDINWRPRDPTDSQDSALSCSVNRNDMPTVKYLVSKGADVNIYFDDGRGNPLREAACNGNFDMVKYLISNGADVNVPKDGKGKTPLIYYIYCSKGTPEIAEYLIKKGADINAKDESGHDAKYWLRQVNDDTKKQKLSEILGIK